MSWKQARVLAEKHEIGAHTRNHPDLSELSYDDLVDEIIGCKDELERELATAVDHFAYPYGQEEHISETAISIAEEAGFRSISSTTGFLPGEIRSFNDMVDTRRWAKAQQAEAKYGTHHSGFRDQHHAEAYLEEFWNSTIESIAGESVLAVGAGTGIIHPMEQPRIQVGVDPLYAINDIDLTESRAFNIAGAGESLPLPEASFDTVISNNVLDHTQNPRAVLQEVGDVIKDNGRLPLVLNTFKLPEFIRRKLRFALSEIPKSYMIMITGDNPRVNQGLFHRITGSEIKPT